MANAAVAMLFGGQVVTSEVRVVASKAQAVANRLEVVPSCEMPTKSRADLGMTYLASIQVALW